MLNLAETPESWSTHLLARAWIAICSTTSAMKRGTTTGKRSSSSRIPSSIACSRVICMPSSRSRG